MTQDMACEPELILEGPAPWAEQIQQQLRALIDSGTLRPGEELPSVRAAAVELAVPPAVIAEAYDALEDEGYIDPSEGAAPRVIHDRHETTQPSERLTYLCQQFVKQLQDSGFSIEDIIRTMRSLDSQEIDHGCST